MVHIHPMRPTKLTHSLLQAFQSVLTDELAAIAFTEEELVWQANQQLPNHERISYRTYQRYKADIMYMEEEGLPDNNEELMPMPTDDEDDDADLVGQMYVCLKDALMKQKLALVRGIYEAKPNWRRYTWMLERKFPDFRLKLTAAINGTPLADKKLESTKGEGKKDKKAPETEAEKQQRYKDWTAQKAAEKAIVKPLTVDQKWESRYHLPWKPMFFGNEGYFKLDKIKELEEEMKRDVAAGYANPHAHLEYRREPLLDDEGGFYISIGMGEGKLPLLVHAFRQADSPKREEYQELWEKQEHKRKNIIRAEQGLPPLDLPEELDDNNHTRRWSASILGHSGG
jgi:hypothetical protein